MHNSYVVDTMEREFYSHRMWRPHIAGIRAPSNRNATTKAIQTEINCSDTRRDASQACPPTRAANARTVQLPSYHYLQTMAVTHGLVGGLSSSTCQWILYCIRQLTYITYYLKSPTYFNHVHLFHCTPSLVDYGRLWRDLAVSGMCRSPRGFATGRIGIHAETSVWEVDKSIHTRV